MARIKSWKIGLGTGFVLLGVYLVFNNQRDILSSLIGITAIALGIGLIVSG